MAKNIDPKLSNIEDYLKLDNGVIFSIPAYQRPYCWEIETCDKLWQDIMDKNNEIEGTDNYFFGTIIISCSNNDYVMNLIDGQQRTTTFILILKALLMRINEAILKFSKGDEESNTLLRNLSDKRRRIIEILYGIDKEEVSDIPDEGTDKQIYISRTILENNANNEDYSIDIKTILNSFTYEEAEKNVIHKFRLKNDNKYSYFFRNFKFFYNEKCNMSESNLNKVTKTILEKCEVIEIKSWDLDQAIKMFNSLNSDGQPLCDSDIISSLLYSEAKNQNVLDEFEKKWKLLRDIIKPLEEKKIISIDSLLMQEMYYERSKNGETINSSGSIDVTTPGLRKYYKSNQTFIRNPLISTDNLINLASIWEKASKYPNVKVLSKFNDNYKLFLASFFYRYKSDDIIDYNYLDGDQLSKEMIESLSEADIAELERKLLIKKDNDIIIECMLRLFTILELVDIGYSSNKFKTFLFGIERKLLNKSISISEIKDDFDNHISQNWPNKYDITEGIKNCEDHCLVFLNEYLFVSFDLDEQYNIEHIMPASGKEIEGISIGAGMDNMDEFNLYVNKLGNKILLESKINQSVSNTWFRMKITSTLKENGYKDSKYPIAKYLVNKYTDAKDKQTWTKFDISTSTDKSTERIVKFLYNE